MIKNQKGFGLVESLLTILILAVVGFGGYYVWHARHNKSTVNSYASCVSANGVIQQSYPEKCTKNGKSYTNPSQNTSNTSANNSSQNAQRYLTIAEWVAKLPLSDGDSGAYYTYVPQAEGTLYSYVSIFDKTIDAITNSQGQSCKDGGYPLFIIDRVKTSDVSQTSDINSQYFIDETNIDMYKTFSFTKDYKFIGRAIHQSAPPCEEWNGDGSVESSSIDTAYSSVWQALTNSYGDMQGE